MITSLIRSFAATAITVGIVLPMAGLAYADPVSDTTTVPVPPPADSSVGSIPEVIPEPVVAPPGINNVPLAPPPVEAPLPVQVPPPAPPPAPVVVPVQEPAPAPVPAVQEPVYVPPPEPSVPEVVQQVPDPEPIVVQEEVPLPAPSESSSPPVIQTRQDPPVAVVPPAPPVVPVESPSETNPEPAIAVQEAEPSVVSPAPAQSPDIPETAPAPEVSSNDEEPAQQLPVGEPVQTTEQSRSAIAPPVATDIPIPEVREVPTVTEDLAAIEAKPVFQSRIAPGAKDNEPEVNTPEVQAKLDRNEIETVEAVDVRRAPKDWGRDDEGDDDRDYDHRPPKPLDPDTDHDKVRHEWRDRDRDDRDNDDRDHEDRDCDKRGNDNCDRYDRDWDDVRVDRGPNGRPMVINNTVNIVNIYIQNFITNEVRVMPVYPNTPAYIGGNLCGGGGASFGWSANAALGAPGFAARFSAGGMFSVGGSGCGYIPPPVYNQPLYFTAAGYGQWNTPNYSQPAGCGCVYSGGAYMYGQYQNQPVYVPGYQQPQIRPVFIVDGWKGDYVFERQLTGGLPPFLTGENPSPDEQTLAAQESTGHNDFVLWVLGFTVLGAAGIGVFYNREWILRQFSTR